MNKLSVPHQSRIRSRENWAFTVAMLLVWFGIISCTGEQRPLIGSPIEPYSEDPYPGSEEPAGVPIQPTGITWSSSSTSSSIVTDTIQLNRIAVASCLEYEGFQEHGAEYRPYEPSIGYVQSPHELTCRWAASQDLSIDSIRLPHYVEVMSDTLRLAEDAFAYAVQLRPPFDDRYRVNKTLYFVTTIADSLYYRRLQSFGISRSSPSMTIRGLRRLDVPHAQATYLWVKTEKRHTSTRGDTLPTTRVEWRGHVLTYDPSRGVRYLSKVPIREEKIRDGETVAFEQWDVSFPEPGIMMVGVRERKGEVSKGSPYFAPPEWLGPNLIDREAVSDSSRYRYLLEEQDF